MFTILFKKSQFFHSNVNFIQKIIGIQFFERTFKIFYFKNLDSKINQVQEMADEQESRVVILHQTHNDKGKLLFKNNKIKTTKYTI